MAVSGTRESWYPFEPLLLLSRQLRGSVFASSAQKAIPATPTSKHVSARAINPFLIELLPMIKPSTKETTIAVPPHTPWPTESPTRGMARNEKVKAQTSKSPAMSPSGSNLKVSPALSLSAKVVLKFRKGRTRNEETNTPQQTYVLNRIGLMLLFST